MPEELFKGALMVFMVLLVWNLILMARRGKDEGEH